MIIYYRDILLRLMNKNIKNTITKNQIQLLSKLEEWYLTTLS